MISHPGHPSVLIRVCRDLHPLKGIQRLHSTKEISPELSNQQQEAAAERIFVQTVSQCDKTLIIHR